MTPPTPTPGTLCEAFQHTAAIDPDSVGLRTVGDSRTLTWQTLAEEVRLMAAGLSRLGVRRGDAVALMMSNRIDFYPIDIAAQHLGATPFSVYNTLPANQIGQVLHNSGATVVLCEAQYVDTLRASGAAVQHLVIVDGRVDNALTLDDVRAFGQANSTFDFEGTWRAVQPNDVLTLIYTSGTTGDPKGVEITHGNMLAQATGVSQVLDFRFGDRITSYLPSAHIADRFTGLYAHEIFGTQITVVGDIKAIAQALPDCRPTIWGGCTPRLGQDQASYRAGHRR